MVSREEIEGERDRADVGVDGTLLNELLLPYECRDGNDSLYFCGPSAGLLLPLGVADCPFWSTILPGNDVGWGAPARLWSGEAGRLRRDEERAFKDECCGSGDGCIIVLCAEDGRGVISSSLSSCMASIVLSYQPGERGGAMYPSSWLDESGDLALAGDRWFGLGLRLPDCCSNGRSCRGFGREWALVISGALNSADPLLLERRWLLE